MSEELVFNTFAQSTFEVDGTKVDLTETKIVESRANKLARHHRMHMVGQRLDRLGSEARTWTLSLEWYNNEEGTNDYPTQLLKLLRLFTKQQVGELYTPTSGYAKVGALSYSRTESTGKKDYASMEIVFVEDTTDDAAKQWKEPSARAVLVNEGTAVAEDSDEIGTDVDPQNEFDQACREAENAARKPTDYYDHAANRMDRVVRRIEGIERAYTETGSRFQSEVNTMASDPNASRVGVALQRIGNVCLRTSAKSGGGRTRYVRFANATTILAVARAVNQDAKKLAALNRSKIPDLMHIPAQTPVKVYAAA